MSKSSLQVALEALRVQWSEECAKRGMALTAAALGTLDDHVVAQFSANALKALYAEADDESMQRRCLQLLGLLFVSNLRLTALLVAIIEDENDDEILAEFSTALDHYAPALPAPAAQDVVVAVPAQDAVASASSAQPAPAARASTPFSYTTDSMMNSKGECETEMRFLKNELQALHYNLLDFFDLLFQPPDGVWPAVNAALAHFKNGPHPQYDSESQSWVHWPACATETAVRPWLNGIGSDLLHFLENYNASSEQPLPLRQMFSQNLSSSTLHDQVFNSSNHTRRKPDAAVVKATLYTAPKHWNQIMVPIKLKKNVSDDPVQVFYDLSKSITKVFRNQLGRVFVLGLTLCSDQLRVWHVDRSGPLGSVLIDINKRPEWFLYVLVSLHCLSSEELGFDRSLQYTKEGLPYIRVPDYSARFLLLECILLPRRIICRGTTVWRGRFEGSDKDYIVKWSWQSLGRDEGRLLELVKTHRLRNVGHALTSWTVSDASDEAFDIYHSVRKQINIRGGNFHVNRGALINSEPDLPPTSRSNTSSLRRSAPEASSQRRSSKRTREEPPGLPMNRILRYVLLEDVGKPIVSAESPDMLLLYIIQCIEGHQQLFEAGMLHRDISINNLMINTDTSNRSRLAFLIDLDHAIKLNEPSSSDDTQCRTGTRMFMSCRILSGQGGHYLEDDLESFFWVLFWICCHYDGPGSKPQTVQEFESWYTMSDKFLANIKMSHFDNPVALENSLAHMKDFYYPLKDTLKRFAHVMGPSARPRCDDQGLYDRLLKALRQSLRELRQKQKRSS